MSSASPQALALLDDSLAQFCKSLEKLEAAKSVNIAEVIEQINTATKSADELSASVLSEMPDATWQSRKELESLLEEIQKRVEARNIEQMRARLLALATELEQGTIVHRRAVRVTQLNQLREEAIKELQVEAEAEGKLKTLPGPEATTWMAWACSLQEPEDSAALQVLREGFPYVDDFVANLEPGNWVGKTSLSQAGAEADKSEGKPDVEQLRARLLNLASVLESGHIVHHRASRVTQLNELRSEAIKDLRLQAKAEGTPRTLPGPGAEFWLDWACHLQEPEDADSLQHLRNGFPHLDEFVANLEPNMWVPAESTTSDAVAGQMHQHETSEGFEESLAASGPIPIKLKAGKSSAPHKEAAAAPVESAFTSAAPAGSPGAESGSPMEDVVESSATASILSQLKSRYEQLGEGKWRMPAIAAVLLLGVLGIGGWMWHRRHTSDVLAKSLQTMPSDSSQGNAMNSPAGQPETGGSQTLEALKAPQPKDQGIAPASPSTGRNDKQPRDQGAVDGRSPTRQVSKLDNGPLRTPEAMPRNVAATRIDDIPPNSAAGVAGSVPGGLASGTPNSVMNVVKDTPAAKPKIAGEKNKVFSGVAQGLLIHQVLPHYPPQAKQLGIQGTVVLQAVIGKDGTVRNVHAVSGNPVLVPAAVDAVKQWRYKPYSVDGEPVEANVQIKINFAPPS